jgi:superfamily II DNA or RNA helicase
MLIVTVHKQCSLEHLEALPRHVTRRITERLTFDNPTYIENEKRGFSNWSTPRRLCYLKEDGKRLILPRGFTRQLVNILKASNMSFRIDDRRRVLPEVDFQFNGELRDFQQEALQSILERDFGAVSMPTGAGKTVVALAAIAARKQPALVVVHTKELLDQWVSRIETFLGIPAGEVRRIGDGKLQVGERITVALVQSLFKCADDVAPYVGHLIVDECHRTPSRTFTEAISAFDCRYQLGLSATPFRRDGLGRLIWWFLGDKVYEVERDGLIEEGHVLPATVVWRDTRFVPSVDPSDHYSQMLSELTEDPTRNRFIVNDVVKAARNGRGVCLVLSDRKAHCNELASLLERHGLQPAVLTGDLSNTARADIVRRLEENEVKVLVATAQLIGEGFDSKQLSTLFLATPIKFSGRLLQCLGRILRPAPGKDTATVYDYRDPVGVLRAAAKSRSRVYERV